MNLIPLLIEQVPEYWPILLPGFKEALIHSNGDDNLSYILSSALNGTLIIWVGLHENKLVGFITTRYKDTPEKCLILDHAWQSKEFKPFLFTDVVLQYMEKYAKGLNCKCIRTYSLRNVSKYYKRYGYYPSYTEYKKELEYENL